MHNKIFQTYFVLSLPYTLILVSTFMAALGLQQQLSCHDRDHMWYSLWSALLLRARKSQWCSITQQSFKSFINCCNVTFNFCFNTSCIPIMSKPEKKRKGDFKWHTCKAQWSVDYFIKLNGNALCLLHNDTIAMLNEYNICWHYQTKQPSQYFQHTGKQESEKIRKFKRK